MEGQVGAELGEEGGEPLFRLPFDYGAWRDLQRLRRTEAVVVEELAKLATQVLPLTQTVRGPNDHTGHETTTLGQTTSLWDVKAVTAALHDAVLVDEEEGSELATVQQQQQQQPPADDADSSGLRDWQKTILQVRLRRQEVAEFTRKQDVLQLVEVLRRGGHVDSLAREGTVNLHGLFRQIICWKLEEKAKLLARLQRVEERLHGLQDRQQLLHERASDAFSAKATAERRLQQEGGLRHQIRASALSREVEGLQAEAGRLQERVEDEQRAMAALQLELEILLGEIKTMSGQLASLPPPPPDQSAPVPSITTSAALRLTAEPPPPPPVKWLPPAIKIISRGASPALLDLPQLSVGSGGKQSSLGGKDLGGPVIGPPLDLGATQPLPSIFRSQPPLQVYLASTPPPPALMDAARSPRTLLGEAATAGLLLAAGAATVRLDDDEELEVTARAASSHVRRAASPFEASAKKPEGANDAVGAGSKEAPRPPWRRPVLRDQPTSEGTEGQPRSREEVKPQGAAWPGPVVAEPVPERMMGLERQAMERGAVTPAPPPPPPPQQQHDVPSPAPSEPAQGVAPALANDAHGRSEGVDWEAGARGTPSPDGLVSEPELAMAQYFASQADSHDAATGDHRCGGWSDDSLPGEPGGVSDQAGLLLELAPEPAGVAQGSAGAEQQEQEEEVVACSPSYWHSMEEPRVQQPEPGGRSDDSSAAAISPSSAEGPGGAAALPRVVLPLASSSSSLREETDRLEARLEEQARRAYEREAGLQQRLMQLARKQSEVEAELAQLSLDDGQQGPSSSEEAEEDQERPPMPPALQVAAEATTDGLSPLDGPGGLLPSAAASVQPEVEAAEEEELRAEVGRGQQLEQERRLREAAMAQVAGLQRAQSELEQHLRAEQEIRRRILEHHAAVAVKPSPSSSSVPSPGPEREPGEPAGIDESKAEGGTAAVHSVAGEREEEAASSQPAVQEPGKSPTSSSMQDDQEGTVGELGGSEGARGAVVDTTAAVAPPSTSSHGSDSSGPGTPPTEALSLQDQQDPATRVVGQPEAYEDTCPQTEEKEQQQLERDLAGEEARLLERVGALERQERDLLDRLQHHHHQQPQDEDRPHASLTADSRLSELSDGATGAGEGEDASPLPSSLAATTQLERVQREKDELLEHMAELQRRRTELEVRELAAGGQVRSVQAQLREASRRERQAWEQAAQQQARVEGLEAELAALQATIEEQQAQIGGLEAQRRALEQEVQELDEENAELEERLFEQQCNPRAPSSSGAYTPRRGLLHAKASAAAAENEMLHDRLAAQDERHQEERAALTARLESAGRESETLRERWRVEEAAKKEALGELVALRRSVAALQADKAGLLAQLRSATQEEALLKELERLREEKRRTEVEMRALEGKRNELDAQRMAATFQCKAFHEQLKAEKQARQELQARVAELTQEAKGEESLQRQLEGLIDRCATLEAQKVHHEEELEQLQQARALLEAQLREHLGGGGDEGGHTRRKSLISKVGVLQEERADLEARLHREQQLHRAMEGEKRALEAQAAELGRRLDQVQEEQAALRQHAAALEQENAELRQAAVESLAGLAGGGVAER